MKSAPTRMLVLSMLAVAVGSFVALAPAKANAACPDPANIQGAPLPTLRTSGLLMSQININGQVRSAKVGTVTGAVAVNGDNVVVSLTATVDPDCGKIDVSVWSVSLPGVGAKIASIGGAVDPAVNPWTGSVTVPAEMVGNSLSLDINLDVTTVNWVSASGGTELGIPGRVRPPGPKRQLWPRIRIHGP